MSYKPLKFCVMLNETNAEYLTSSGYSKAKRSETCCSQTEVARLLEDDYQASMQAQECLWIVALDARLKCIGTFEVSRGSVNGTMFPVRETMRNALMCGAVTIIVAHNHPSGDVQPSKQDIESTKRVSGAGKIVGIPVTDHVIIGREETYSFKQEMPELFE